MKNTNLKKLLTELEENEKKLLVFIYDTTENRNCPKDIPVPGEGISSPPRIFNHGTWVIRYFIHWLTEEEYKNAYEGLQNYKLIELIPADSGNAIPPQHYKLNQNGIDLAKEIIASNHRPEWGSEIINQCKFQ